MGKGPAVSAALEFPTVPPEPNAFNKWDARAVVDSFTSEDRRREEVSLRTARARLDDLVSLRRGWDGHSGVPVARMTANFALKALGELLHSPKTPLPLIMPLSYGGVQLEWHRKGWDIEIEISRPCEVYFWARSIGAKSEQEYEIQSDFGPVLHLVAHISN